ncbi:hypothetical protein NUACC21_07840 [Scytonema sp. NUACC21]
MMSDLKKGLRNAVVVWEEVSLPVRALAQVKVCAVKTHVLVVVPDLVLKVVSSHYIAVFLS